MKFKFPLPTPILSSKGGGDGMCSWDGEKQYDPRYREAIKFIEMLKKLEKLNGTT